MTDAERELMEMMVAALCSANVVFNQKAVQNLLTALKRYQQERESALLKDFPG